jgi:predicted regulator of Ras-like GTPase activity (Roadblock/LC7/MglB family)
MESFNATLSTFRDVEGVRGSFIVTNSGTLVARDLPAMFTDALLDQVGPRVVRLREALGSVGSEVETCLIRFAEHKVFLKSLPHGMLCVVTATGVNIPALKMAANLAGRRIGPELEQRSLGAAPPARSPASVPPANPDSGPRSAVGSYPPPAGPAGPAEEAKPASAKYTMIYRGHRVP